MAGKEVKIGVRQGGTAPAYIWTVKILDMAYREALGFLSKAEYTHMAMQVKLLATEITPSHSQLCSVDAIEDFHEIRDWGGPLGGKNVRVFFGLMTGDGFKDIVVLGAIVKQNNGPTPQGDKIRMRRRWRKYKAGEFSP
ncbi:MAG: hypothetical protein WD872_14605 [Pirellulaceae bacterium]